MAHNPQPSHEIQSAPENAQALSIRDGIIEEAVKFFVAIIPDSQVSPTSTGYEAPARIVSTQMTNPIVKYAMTPEAQPQATAAPADADSSMAVEARQAIYRIHSDDYELTT